MKAAVKVAGFACAGLAVVFRALAAAVLAAADAGDRALLDAYAQGVNAGGAPPPAVWGERNLLQSRHPFSRLLPGFVAKFLDAPAQVMPGDRDMPRGQRPGFSALQRMAVAPGREREGTFHMPGGQSGHPLSPHYRTGYLHV